jgi:hypothetical protein
MITESLLSNLTTHLIVFFAGASGLGLVAHAVSTFPVPENKYGKWLLGTIQYVVGQRLQGINTLNGHDTKVTPDPTAKE